MVTSELPGRPAIVSGRNPLYCTSILPANIAIQGYSYTNRIPSKCLAQNTLDYVSILIRESKKLYCDTCFGTPEMRVIQEWFYPLSVFSE